MNVLPFSPIIVIGTVAFDEIMDFPGEFRNYFHPEKLHQINVSFVVSKLEKQLGGTATNIAYNVILANSYLKNDSNKTYIVSAVGKDGKEFMDFFKENKIDSEYLIVNNELYTATGKVITDKKDNQIWGFYYGASRSAKRIKLNKFVPSKTLAILSATHPDVFLNLQKQLVKYKMNYIYDPGMTLTWIKNKDLKQGVYQSKYLIGNDYEISMILRRISTTVKFLNENGISVITTLGEKGVKYEGGSGMLEVGGYKVKEVIDPTGAGDAWRGGFIAGTISGKPIKECLELGNAIASFAVETYGTVNHKPAIGQIYERLNRLQNI